MQGKKGVEIDSPCLTIYTFDHYGCYGPADVWKRHGHHEGVSGSQAQTQKPPPYMLEFGDIWNDGMEAVVFLMFNVDLAEICKADATPDQPVPCRSWKSGNMPVWIGPALFAS